LNKNQEKSELGIKGEEIACKYLITKGYQLLHKNWRCKHKEIDIIVEKNNILTFVEVKTRSTSYFERPQDAVTLKKQRLLISAANEYIIQKEIDKEIQFDIVSIIIENGKQTIEHIPNAFYPIV